MLEIKKLLELRWFIRQKIEHRQNRVAHSLANIDRFGGSTPCWLRHVPESVAEDVFVTPGYLAIVIPC